jgi:hypothetical protein
MEANPMYCPRCHAEYNPEVVTCADCGVALVPVLVDPTKRKPKEFVEVVSTFNLGDIALIRSLLNNEHIEFFFQGENFNQVDPLIQPVKLFVRKEKAARVQKLLSGMNVTFLGVSATRK